MYTDDPEHEATPIGGEVPFLTPPSKAVADGLVQYLSDMWELHRVAGIRS